MSNKDQPRLNPDGLKARELDLLTQILNNIQNSLQSLESQPATTVGKKRLLGKMTAKDYRVEIHRDAKGLMAAFNEWRERPQSIPPENDARPKCDDSHRTLARTVLCKFYPLITRGGDFEKLALP